MKKIIENLQALIDSINFAETEHSANYVITEPDKKLLNEALDEALQIHNVSGSLLKSLHQDLKGFQEMEFLTPDVKSGLGIAIEQVERYMRGDLEARQQ